MALSCGIVGLPTVGKSTLFQLLTGAEVEKGGFFSGKTATNTGRAQIPDQRVDWLAEFYHPKKTTPAQMDITDLPGLVRGSSKGEGVGNSFLNSVRQVDALVHVLRGFTDSNVSHVDGKVDPTRDLETLNLELLLADLQLVETRLERLAASRKKTAEQLVEEQVLHKAQSVLEAEQNLSKALTPEENSCLEHLNFLTQKPQLLVLNTGQDEDTPGHERVLAAATQIQLPVLELSVQLELEIQQLEPQERPEFMADLGIEEPGVHRLARAMYHQLRQISFLTAGHDEVRAWTIHQGITAQRAAGKIHSDIERGFIRAEVVAFADLFQTGTMAAARTQGKVRLEGKEYVVADGDVINFRFNV